MLGAAGPPPFKDGLIKLGHDHRRTTRINSKLKWIVYKFNRCIHIYLFSFFLSREKWFPLYMRSRDGRCPTSLQKLSYFKPHYFKIRDSHTSYGLNQADPKSSQSPNGRRPEKERSKVSPILRRFHRTWPRTERCPPHALNRLITRGEV